MSLRQELKNLKERTSELERMNKQRLDRSGVSISQTGLRLNSFIPIEPTSQQEKFLTADALEVLYGGAARGGKTTAELAAALQYVDVPGYRALLLRRSFADLMLPESLIPLSHRWLQGKATWNGKLNEWTFPTGSTLTFGYLQNELDKYRYQGAELQFIGFDELTQFTEGQYTYLFSRLCRKTGVNVPLRMRAGSNPGGIGHDWVKRRFLQSKEPCRQFIPARLEDNPHVDQKAYEISLKQLDPVTRQQLRLGDWDIVADGIFRRAWLKYFADQGSHYVLHKPDGDQRVLKGDQVIFQTVDLALGTKASNDFTVIATWALTAEADLLLLEIQRLKMEAPEVKAALQNARRRWNPSFQGIEKAHYGAAVCQEWVRLGLPLLPLIPDKDKVTRSLPATLAFENGKVFLLRDAIWLADYESELLMFPHGGNDDMVDVTSYAARLVSQRALNSASAHVELPAGEFSYTFGGDSGSELNAVLGPEFDSNNRIF
jgi:predicted phage terminase large subunit-like protein